MNFNIPMKTKGVISLNDLSSMSNMVSPIAERAGVVNTTPVSRSQGKSHGVLLQKGQKFVLNATDIKVCVGWKSACDLDVSAFMLGSNGKVIGDDWFIFYGKTVSPDGSIIHSGDNNGDSNGDNEVVSMKLQDINQNVQKVVFVVTINEALKLGLNFSMVSDAYVRVVDNRGVELMRFVLSDYYSNVTSMMVGAVYKRNGVWKFDAIGDGVSKDLAGLCRMYGVDIAEG